MRGLWVRLPLLALDEGPLRPPEFGGHPHAAESGGNAQAPSLALGANAEMLRRRFSDRALSQIPDFGQVGVEVLIADLVDSLLRLPRAEKEPA